MKNYNYELAKIKKEKSIELVSAALSKIEEKMTDNTLVAREQEGFLKLKYATVSLLMNRDNAEIALFIYDNLKAQVIDYDTKCQFMKIRDAIIARDKQIAAKKAEEAFNKEVEEIRKEFNENVRELDIIFS